MTAWSCKNTNGTIRLQMIGSKPQETTGRQVADRGFSMFCSPPRPASFCFGSSLILLSTTIAHQHSSSNSASKHNPLRSAVHSHSSPKSFLNPLDRSRHYLPSRSLLLLTFHFSLLLDRGDDGVEGRPLPSP